jgi:hypothetical protein
MIKWPLPRVTGAYNSFAFADLDCSIARFVSRPFSVHFHQLIRHVNYEAIKRENVCFCADVVPPDLRTTIYAFDRAFEGAISALAAPLVGVMAEVLYGYKFDVLKASEPSASNARALSRGLFACMAPSFAICAATYSLIYRTYHKDKERVDAGLYKDKQREPFRSKDPSSAFSNL